MTGRAYIGIRPGREHPIHVICKLCDLDQPSPRWHTALHDCRHHNRTNHGTP